jgi:hypothetical protein
MPVAQFQGVLPIPIFLAPFTFTSIGGSWISWNPVNSDWAMFSLALAKPAPVTTQGFMASTYSRYHLMQPSGAITVQMGNSAINTGNLDYECHVAIGNAAYRIAVHHDGTNVNSTYPVYGTEILPIYQSFTDPNPPGLAAWETQTGGATYNAYGNFSIIGKIGVLVQELGKVLPAAAHMYTNNSSVVQTMGAVLAQNPATASFAGLAQEFGPLGYGAWPNGFFTCDQVTGNNIFWCIPASLTSVTLQTLNVQMSIATGVITPLWGQGVSFTFDNPALNTILASAAMRFNPTSNGVWCTNGTNNTDYYITNDGTRYWQVQYVYQQNSRKISSSASELGRPTRFVDAAGNFWYAGLGSQVSGGLLQPLTSFGANIGFDPITLQMPPPLSFPCWSTCLDRIGGTPSVLSLD